jgi:hypothetical protein
MAAGERKAPDHRARPGDDLRGKGPDLLSPDRALRESVGASRSQRIGNNGAVANPDVSFPGEVSEADAER